MTVHLVDYLNFKHTFPGILINFYLISLVGPILSAFNNFTQNVTESNSLVIEVEFIANPKPNISWYLQNDPATGVSFIIHENHTKYKTNLHRTQVKRQVDRFCATCFLKCVLHLTFPIARFSFILPLEAILERFLVNIGVCLF